MPDSCPLQCLLTTFAGWINRRQAEAIDYLVEENRVLKKQLGRNRLRLTNDQRRRLAAKSKLPGRRLLGRIATIVTPDTIMRWHRKLIVRFATDNSSRGYCRIQGELRKLNHCVAPSTIAQTLKDHGIRQHRNNRPPGARSAGPTQA